MKVSIISCVYPPEPVVSARTSADVAHALQQAGHSVKVITGFPNRPAGKLYEGYTRRLFQNDTHQGIPLLRCWGVFSRHSTLFSRFLENLSFGLTSGLALLLGTSPDVIYSNTWPIFATGIVALIAYIKKIPLVLSVQDVYPESLLAQGRTGKEHIGIRLIRHLDGWIARQAQVVIVISENFARLYRESRGVNDKRLFVVYNWGDEKEVIVQERTNSIRTRHQIAPIDFLLVYGGNIGVAAGVETLIQAMGLLTNVHVKALIAGDGSQMLACRELAGKLTTHNVLFQSPWLTAETTAVLAAADILVLPTLGKQSVASVPSKLIYYLLAARPIIALAHANTDVAGIIHQADCGWVIAPDQPQTLASLIQHVATLPAQELQRRGQLGREFALQHFSRTANVVRVVHIMEQAINQGVI